MTTYLWNIVREIVKTAVENEQNLIIEGCYIPYNYKKDFSDAYLKLIKYICIIFSNNYIENNYDVIMQNANVIEKRVDDSYCTKELLLRENKENLSLCIENDCEYILIENDYEEIKYCLSY